jgi:hypothetical protein
MSCSRFFWSVSVWTGFDNRIIVLSRCEKDCLPTAVKLNVVTWSKTAIEHALADTTGVAVVRQW